MSKVDSSAPPVERLRELAVGMNCQADFRAVVAALHHGRTATLDGVWGSSCALVTAALLKSAPATIVVIFSKQAKADDFPDDLALFCQTLAEPFPAWESDSADRPVYDDIYGDRLRTLKRLLGPNSPSLIVTSIQSLLQSVPDPRAVSSNSLRIQQGQPFQLDQILGWLVERGFQSTSAVQLPGEFSVRGGIVDMFAPDWDHPARIELFGDEIDSLRSFDITTQRSIEPLEELEISVLKDPAGDCEYFTSYLNPDTWFVLVEPTDIQAEAHAYNARTATSQGTHPYEELLRRVGEFAHVNASSLAMGESDVTCRLRIQSVERFSGDIGRIRDELEEVGAGKQVFVVCQTDAEIKRLGEIFQNSHLATEERIHFPLGSLHEGFHLFDQSVLIVGGADLFHRTDLQRPVRRHAGKAIDSFLDLREGDLVVHLSHGIGRYRGLKLLCKEDHSEDHLQIEFHGGTSVYVPASKIDLVQKYVGGKKTRPSLAKIGGKTWVRQKRAAESAVTDMAADLLQLQAQRALRPGIAFANDTDWQREFDASFPYVETPDQSSAVEAIKRDMVSPRPMDRLLCGDVGFGKTELAMRAAFKAVDSGYQVALLAPTTILVEQHYHTFQQRMAEFPFQIAKLSRFCTTSQQRENVEGLQAGSIDIVIGTHRLASKDVVFDNLGLVIIDEEQRFGVEVKERLKTLRTEVDVLTMSATPIPRTLHMSLVGLRDISNLETPPEERTAVETKVTRWDENLIRDAVLRELNRGGQIFFVHNRVHDIEAVAARLGRIVPEASLQIGHGQMPESQLEQVMVDFVAHRFDLLLATTIVESGLDIPNANTIFIDDADKYGLADLHQLRGRVGRYKHRAYCYLLVAKHQHLTPSASRRLRAIEEFSEMGAGFAIAMRDLELRGAGNVLGTEQSGHIATIGYELYCQLLEGAVRRLQFLPPKKTIDVNIELPGDAYIPPAYVPHLRTKIDLYRRIARLASDEDLAEFEVELVDRFGKPPNPVRRMLALAALRIDAAFWAVNSIFIEDKYLVFGYSDRGRIQQLAQLRNGRVRVVDGHSAYLSLKKDQHEPDEILDVVKSVLRPN